MTIHFISFLKYLEQREFEENKLRELQDQFLELRSIEQSLIQVHEIFLQLFTSVMEQVSFASHFLNVKFVLIVLVSNVLHVRLQDAPIQRIGDIVWNAKCDIGVGIQSLNRTAELKKKGWKVVYLFIVIFYSKTRRILIQLFSSFSV